MTDLQSSLAKAITVLRSEGNRKFLCSEPDVSTHEELAALMERLAAAAEAGDAASAQRLWLILAPTGAWDEAGMDAMLGQRCFEALDELQRRLWP